MRKLLVSLVALFFLAGCGGSGGDSGPDPASMAGTFAFTKLTATTAGTDITLVPPAISGSIVLTATSRYSVDIFFQGERVTDNGAFSVSEPTITFVSSEDGSSTTGTVADGGRKIVVRQSEDGITMTMEFTKV